ncbi:NAD-dependent epimerase/dehydratase family protein [Bradyrhizobium guangdongense]
MTETTSSRTSAESHSVAPARMTETEGNPALNRTVGGEPSSQATRPLRVGIVGAGYIAEFHARAINSTDGVMLAAVCDSNRENAKSLAAAWNVPLVFEAIDEMIADGELDCIHLLVPPDLHYPLAKKALESGLHVFVEKPMCTSAAQAEDLIALASRFDRLLAVSHNFMFLASYGKFREAVRSGRLGPIDQITFQYLFELPQIRFGPFDAWMLRKPANLMIETGPHLLSILLDLVGAPDDLTVKADRIAILPGGAQVYRRWRALGAARKTAIALTINFGPGFPRRTIFVRGLFGTATLDLDANTCVIDQRTPLDPDIDRFTRTKRIARQLSSQARQTLGDYVFGKLKLRKRGNPYQNSIIDSTHSFYDSVRARVPLDPRISAASGRAVMACCEDLVRAAALPDPAPLAERTLPALTARPTVLVLGAAGFIGRELVQHLLARGYVVRAMVRGSAVSLEELGSDRLEIVRGDVRRKEDLAGALSGIDFVYHLAHASARTWDEYVSKDIDPARLVGETCLAAGVKRLVYTGTISSFYTGSGAGTITEATSLDPKIGSRDYYSRAKAASETILTDMHRLHKLPLVIARPGIVIGKGGTPFHWGVGRFSEHICEVWGNGRHPLPFVLVEDVASALVRMIEVPGIDGRSYNLSDRPLLSAREYLVALERASGLRLDIRYKPIWKLYLADVAKWLVKTAVGHPDRVRVPSYRDWDSRRQVAIFDAKGAMRDLNWKPVGSRDSLIKLGVDEALTSWREALE